MKRVLVLFLAFVLVLPAGSALVVAQDRGPFEGMTPAELFPNAIDD